MHVDAIKLDFSFCVSCYLLVYLLKYCAFWADFSAFNAIANTLEWVWRAAQ